MNHPRNHHFYGWYEPSKMGGLLLLLYRQKKSGPLILQLRSGLQEPNLLTSGQQFGFFFSHLREEMGAASVAFFDIFWVMFLS